MAISKIYIFLLCFLMAITVSSAESIGQRQDAQVGAPYIISQPCATCTGINITVLTKNGIVVENAAMSNNGSTWIYNFTPNSSLRHDVNGNGDKDGLDSSFAFWFDATLSGEQNTTTIIISDIILLLVFISILLIINNTHKKTDFERWNKNIMDDHKNMGQTLVRGLIYGLFKNTFIWFYFIGWILILILKDIVYRFNSVEIYSYFTLAANIYSLGLLLVIGFMIGWFATYIRDSVSTLSDNNWGVGDGE